MDLTKIKKDLASILINMYSYNRSTNASYSSSWQRIWSRC